MQPANNVDACTHCAYLFFRLMLGQKQKDNILDYPRKRMAKHLYQQRCLIYRVVQLMPVIDKLYKVKIKAVNM